MRRLVPCIGIIVSTACIDPFDAGENLQITPERAKDLAETTVEITGEFAAVRYVRDLDDPSAPPAQRMAAVRLGDRSLIGVTAMGEGKLQAVAPVGMNAGPQILRIEDAEGNALTKQAAFCVISAAEQVASVRFSPIIDAVAGEIQISLEALDDDGARVAQHAHPRAVHHRAQQQQPRHPHQRQLQLGHATVHGTRQRNRNRLGQQRQLLHRQLDLHSQQRRSWHRSEGHGIQREHP